MAQNDYKATEKKTGLITHASLPSKVGVNSANKERK